jgi:hypothetical protein
MDVMKKIQENFEIYKKEFNESDKRPVDYTKYRNKLNRLRAKINKNFRLYLVDDNYTTIYNELNKEYEFICALIRAKKKEIENQAWELYCTEHKEDLDARDFWFELSEDIKQEYLNKVKSTNS